MSHGRRDESKALPVAGAVELTFPKGRAMKVVVTGAAGFIGSNLVRQLLKDPTVEVVGVDCFTDYYPETNKKRNLAGIDSGRFRLYEDDLVSVDLGPVVENAVAIFHQAGQPGVRSSWGRDFGVYTRMNIDATQRLLEAAKHVPSLESFVYASSSSVYGDAEKYPTSELDLPKPKSPYGVTKLAAEHLVSLYARNFGLPTVSLRYFTVYGPGQRPDMAFHKFIRAAIENAPLEIYGDGKQIREFTHVDDIVKANLLAWKRRPLPGSVINLSGGASISLKETVEIIESLSGHSLNMSHQKSALGDVFRTGGSTEVAKQVLQWSPSVSIEDGLRSEYEWLLKLTRDERTTLAGKS